MVVTDLYRVAPYRCSVGDHPDRAGRALTLEEAVAEALDETGDEGQPPAVDARGRKGGPTMSEAIPLHY